MFRTGDLEMDFGRRLVTLSGREIHLGPTEYELLKAFATHPNKVMTDLMLLRQVWEPEYADEAHCLRVYVARLRKRIEPDTRNPRYLTTEPGVGYRLLAE